MAWLILVLAGLFECAWAIGLKYSQGFSRPLPTVFTLIALAISIWLLAIAMRSIPVGTAYAAWTGIGVLGVSILGIYLFAEPYNLARIICLLLILSGIIGLKLISP